jgi:hypothetical protein
MKTLTQVITIVGLLTVAAQEPARARDDAPQTPATESLDIERLRVYHGRIVGVANGLPPRASLVELIRPVLQFAGTRGAAEHAAAENRTALIAIAFYVNGWPLHAVVQEARTWPRAARRGLVLRGRGDLTQHFSVSALISAAAGTPIADAAGLYKELDDARSGSGFSFSDLAADRAGTAFGELATKSAASARRLQTRIARGLEETDIMPDVTGLPDNLSESEFTKRFGGVGAPAYNALLDDIARRIAGLALFQ